MSEVDKYLKEADNYANNGDIDSAIAKCEDALRMDSKNTLIYTKLAELYVKKGQKDKASAQYLIIANAYYDSKLFKGAMKYFKCAIELDPQCLDAREKLAEIYENEDMEREAKIELLNIAEIYFSRNDFNKAENFSAKAIELKSIEAHFILGLIDIKREMFKEAISEFEILLKFKLNHIGAISNIAFCYFKLNKFQESINYYEKAVKLAPDDVLLRENLAESYKSSGNSANAVGQYDTLAAIFLESGDKGKAMEIYNKAIKACSDNTIKAELAKKILGLDSSNVDAKKILEAVETEEKKVVKTATPKDEHPRSEASKSKPAAYETKTSLDSEEIGETTPLIDIKGSIEELFMKAEEYLKNGFFEKAIEIYRYILRREPNNIVVRQKLHQAYILAAQQEEEITDSGKATAEKDNGERIKKEKKSKISYL